MPAEKKISALRSSRLFQTSSQHKNKQTKTTLRKKKLMKIRELIGILLTRKNKTRTRKNLKKK